MDTDGARITILVFITCVHPWLKLRNVDESDERDERSTAGAPDPHLDPAQETRCCELIRFSKNLSRSSTQRNRSGLSTLRRFAVFWLAYCKMGRARLA